MKQNPETVVTVFIQPNEQNPQNAHITHVVYGGHTSLSMQQNTTEGAVSNSNCQPEHTARAGETIDGIRQEMGWAENGKTIQEIDQNIANNATYVNGHNKPDIYGNHNPNDIVPGDRFYHNCGQTAIAQTVSYDRSANDNMRTGADVTGLVILGGLGVLGLAYWGSKVRKWE